MAYTKTEDVTAGDTDGLAVQYNSLMAEAKAAVEGIPTHDVDYVITFNGMKIDTITLTDNSGDGVFDITLVGTYTWVGWKITQIVWVFDAGDMNITMTEAFTYVRFNCTAIGRTLS